MAGDRLGASTRRIAGGRDAVFTWRSGGQRDLRMGAGYGLLNVLMYGEERAKADSVVRGGHRSFYTGAHLGGPLNLEEHARTRRGVGRVGGTLRRGWYASVSVEGSLVPGSRTRDGNETPTPRPIGVGPKVLGYFGNVVRYSAWVDQGTSRMPARPMAMPAVSAMTASLGALFKAGAVQYWNSRP